MLVTKQFLIFVGFFLHTTIYTSGEMAKSLLANIAYICIWSSLESNTFLFSNIDVKHFISFWSELQNVRVQLPPINRRRRICTNKCFENLMIDISSLKNCYQYLELMFKSKKYLKIEWLISRSQFIIIDINNKHKLLSCIHFLNHCHWYLQLRYIYFQE